MPEAVLNALLQAGILGPVVICVGWYTLRLQRELKESPEKRVGDAQHVVTQLLELNDRWNEVIQKQATGFDEQKDLIQRIHETMRDLERYMRAPYGGPPGAGS